MLLENIDNHTILSKGLGPQSAVVDLGANTARFSAEINMRYGCHCHVVEANPQIVSALGDTPGMTTHNLAIAGTSGSLQFHLSEDSYCSSLRHNPNITYTKTIEIPALTLEDFAKKAQLNHIDLLKVDIEGAEIEMFEAVSDEFLLRIKQITIEFHDFNGTISPEAVNETVSRLTRLGFYPIKITRKSHFDTLFLNCRTAGLSHGQLIWLRYAVRNWIGFKRVVSRLLHRQ